MSVFAPYSLPNGVELPNRIVKAAMEESFVAPDHVPTPEHFELYRTWAAGGAGTLITGNVMVHDAALTGPRALVLDSYQDLHPYQQWAHAVHAEGAKIWMQINHPGRQVASNTPGVAWAPSDSRVDVGLKAARFADAVAMTEEQIAATVRRFVTTAQLAEQAGFDGVEVHAAHGYLLSQFLSPLVNKRTDSYGGPLENRMRLLLEIVDGIRASVSPEFAVAVKLNSADFQRGGFELDDAALVIQALGERGVDMVELSGGSYESPAMNGRPADERTQAREAYFLEMATQLVESSPLPLMVTGGVTRLATANQVIDSGMALVGMGTALAADPSLPKTWQQNPEATVTIPEPKLKHKSVASAAQLAWVRHQLRRIAKGQDPQVNLDPRIALALDGVKELAAGREYAAWLQQRLERTRRNMAKKVLFVVTAATGWTLKDGTVHPTGFWGEELAVPHQLFTQAGWAITLATPGGVAPTLDELSMGISGGAPALRRRVRTYLASIRDVLAHPLPLDQVNPDDYDLVFYPGGHGPMEDLAVDEVSGALLRRRLEQNQPLALLCHAPAAILAATDPDTGKNAFAGRRMTGLSNREELLNPFAWKAKWLLETEMKRAGVEYSAGFPLRPHVVVDGHLYTGQNPASSAELTERIIADFS